MESLNGEEQKWARKNAIWKMIEGQKSAWIYDNEKRDSWSWHENLALLYPVMQLIGCESSIGLNRLEIRLINLMLGSI